MAPRRPHGPQDDEGFTLVEVIVSLALLTVAATAALYFFVGGTRAVTHQQQSQNAVVVANEAMELAYSVGAKVSSNTSGLLVGRTKADVQAAWASVATEGLEGYANTYPGWDPAATAATGGDDGTEDDAVKLWKTSELNNLDYTALTLIGPCYRSKSAVDAPCGKVGTVEPTSVPTGYMRLMRVMVQVTWQSQSCPEDGCSYQVASLIDPSTDLTWNNTTRPIAVDDDAVVDVGKSLPIEVLKNDILGVVVANPVRLESPPAAGAGTATVQTDGQIFYVAPTNASGIKTFTYSLKDQSGRESNDATVRVRVMPKAVDDAASTSAKTPVTIPVTANDLGSPKTVTIVQKPAWGSATVSGTSIVFNPGNQFGTVTLRYKYADADLLESNEATVTINVSQWAPPKVQDLTVAIPATVNGSKLDLNMLGLTGNPTNYLVEVMSVTANQGRLFVGAGAYNASNNRIGTSISYEQQGNVLGIWTFQYRVTTPDQSVQSEVKTVTLKIMPVAQPDSFKNMKRNSTVDLAIGANDAPMNYGGTVQLTPTMSSIDCTNNVKNASFPTQQNNFQNGILRFTTPGAKSTCTFTYTLQGKGAYTDLVSAPVTVTVEVVN